MVPGAEIEVCLWQIWIQAAKVGAFPPELGCSAACKTAGLGFVHHLSPSTLKLALVLVQCFSPSIVLYLYLDLLLDLAKNITGNITYLMFRFRRSGLMMKCEEEMFRPIGAECLGRLMDSKIVYLTLTDSDILFLLSSVSSPVDENCQARVNKSPHHRRPPRRSERQTTPWSWQASGARIMYKWIMERKWNGTLLLSQKMIPLILVVGFSCFVGLILEIIMCWFQSGAAQWRGIWT